MDRSIVSKSGKKYKIPKGFREEWEYLNTFDEMCADAIDGCEVQDYTVPYTDEEVSAMLTLHKLEVVSRGKVGELSEVEHIVPYFSPLNDSWRLKVYIDKDVLDKKTAYLLLGRYIRRYGLTVPVNEISLTNGTYTHLLHEEENIIRPQGIEQEKVATFLVQHDPVLNKKNMEVGMQLDWLSIITGVLYNRYISPTDDDDWKLIAKLVGDRWYDITLRQHNDFGRTDTSHRSVNIMGEVSGLRSFTLDSRAGLYGYPRRLYNRYESDIQIITYPSIDRSITISVVPFVDKDEGPNGFDGFEHMLRVRDRRAHPSQFGLGHLLEDYTIEEEVIQKMLRQKAKGKITEGKFTKLLAEVAAKSSTYGQRVIDEVMLLTSGRTFVQKTKKYTAVVDSTEDPIIALWNRFGSEVLGLVAEVLLDYASVLEEREAIEEIEGIGKYEGDYTLDEDEIFDDDEFTLLIQDKNQDIPMEILEMEDDDPPVGNSEMGAILMEENEEYKNIITMVNHILAVLSTE